MPNLVQLIRTWVEQHPLLKNHYQVKDFNATNQRGEIRFWCANGDNDLVDIYDNKLVWYMSEVYAADPTLFQKLEEYLLKYHDRASVSNLIMFKFSCETKLHNCSNPKTFCACP